MSPSYLHHARYAWNIIPFNFSEKRYVKVSTMLSLEIINYTKDMMDMINSCFYAFRLHAQCKQMRKAMCAALELWH